MLTWLSTGAGLLAAALWFYASIIKVPTNISSGYGGTVVGVEEMAAGFKKQSAWNSYAAVMTAAAASFQAVAQLTGT